MITSSYSMHMHTLELTHIFCLPGIIPILLTLVVLWYYQVRSQYGYILAIHMYYELVLAMHSRSMHNTPSRAVYLPSRLHTPSVRTMHDARNSNQSVSFLSRIRSPIALECPRCHRQRRLALLPWDSKEKQPRLRIMCSYTHSYTPTNG